MSAPRAVQQPHAVVGSWRLIASPPGLEARDISFVRGVPSQLGDWEFADPFGPVQCSVTFPKVTIFDQLGAGELDWLAEGTDVDVVWVGALPAGYPDGAFRWEGYMESFDFNESGLTVSMKGALQQFDNYLAKPEFTQRPIPYEYALQRQWADRPDLRVRQLQIEWPSWWTTTYAPVRGPLPYMVPTGVVPGDNWTGLVTRQTGAWEPCLTNYMQTLLASMYTTRGRWTLDLTPFRQPVLRHRDFKHEPDATTLVVDPAAPGVKVSLSTDFSQRLNVVYGQGRALTGEAYSGMQVSTDGLRTRYKPLAALRQVEPVSDKNGWLQPSRMRKEVLLQLQEGLEAQEAQRVAQDHLAHFAEPGLQGTITLTSDPLWGTSGTYLPRVLIKAGMTLQLQRALGRPEGVLLHVTGARTSLANGTVTLTVDSKYRDKLTADEVRLRGRDALSVTRMLIAGQYQPPLPDQLLPWNYTEGSGHVPSGPEYSSLPLFRGMPDEIGFPWTEWTTQRPPRSKSWKDCYIRIGPKSANADDNWARVSNRRGGQFGFPIKLSQAGSIRLIQIAAYDRNGNVMKVPFHFSIYQNSNVNVFSMPKISTAAQATETKYAINQHYPFFDEAWETYRLDGTQRQTEEPVQVSSVGMVRAWGTKRAPAGYWPGSKATGDPPTGLLVDEATWDYQLNGFDKKSSIDPYTTRQTSPFAGFVYGMIYCDAQLTEEVFFLGRIWRAEPGTTS